MLRLALLAAALLSSSAVAQIAQQPERPPAQLPAARYACPMKCEGDKTYDAPGKCPVCNMALKAVTPAPTLTVNTDALKSGEPSTLSLTLKDGLGLAPRGPVDVITVLTDLSWMDHQQLQPGADGSLKLSQTFSPGAYIVFAAPAAPPSAWAKATLEVSGKPPIPKAMGVDADRPHTVEGYTATLGGFSHLKSGQSSTLTIHVERDGKPATDLASPRLLAVSQDLKQALIAEPSGGAGAASDVGFLFQPERAGLHRIWAEFHAGPKTITFPFVIEVDESAAK
jgi:hypothetical protein